MWAAASVRVQFVPGLLPCVLHLLCVAWLSPPCYITVTLPLHCRYIAVTLPLQLWPPGARLLPSHYRYVTVTSPQVHGCCGFWACVATSLFSVPDYAWGAGGGLFYGEGKQLGIVLLLALAQIAWVSVRP